VSKELLRITDMDDDQLVVQESFAQPGLRLFLSVMGEGVYLQVDDVKKLRKVLKNWLIDSGHKAA
jgi:hypothetical protein